METIKREANRNAKLATNVDVLRSRYVDANDEVSVYFPAFEIWSYEQKLFELLESSQKVPYQTRWNQRPDYVSFDFYSTVVYWEVILFVNQINNIEDFMDLDHVFIPSFNKILELVKVKPEESEILNVNEEPTPSPNYYKLYPLSDEEIARRKAADNLEDYEPAIPEWVDGESVDGTDVWPWTSGGVDEDDGDSEWSPGSGADE